MMLIRISLDRPSSYQQARSDCQHPLHFYRQDRGQVHLMVCAFVKEAEASRFRSLKTKHLPPTQYAPGHFTDTKNT